MHIEIQVYTLVDVGLAEESYLALFLFGHCKYDHDILFLIRGEFSYIDSINYTP